MATVKGYNTIEEVNAIIKEEAESAGFTTHKSDIDGVLRINAENLNVFTNIDRDYHWEDSCVIGKVSFSASISRMGGNPTPDELINVADEITECARLVARLNIMDLEFAKSFK